jgi:hypothetical protein
LTDFITVSGGETENARNRSGAQSFFTGFENFFIRQADESQN